MKYLILFITLLLIIILSFYLRTILLNKELFYSSAPKQYSDPAYNLLTGIKKRIAELLGLGGNYSKKNKQLEEEIIMKNCNNEEHDNIISNKNLFVDKSTVKISNINCEKLCIIEDNGNVECITKADLFNAINLPGFRKHSICIGDSCITNNVINKVNGSEKINFKSNYLMDPTFKNKCINISKEDTRTCGRKKYNWETGSYLSWGTQYSYHMPKDWNERSGHRRDYNEKKGWDKAFRSDTEGSQWERANDNNFKMELLNADNCDKDNTKNDFVLHQGLPISAIKTDIINLDYNYVPKKVSHNTHIKR